MVTLLVLVFIVPVVEPMVPLVVPMVPVCGAAW